MIFVTVGTAAPFEKLIKAIDKLNEDIICQTGLTKYKPKNCKYFDFKPSIDKYFNEAELIITHGGAGSIYRLLELGKKVIGVMNDERKGDLHQEEILKKLSNDNYLIWCKDVTQLSDYVVKAQKFKFKKYVKPKCAIADEIIKFIGE